MSLAACLNKYWRILATCFCFFLFAFGGLLLSFLVFPVLVLFVKNKAQRELKVQSVIQKSFFLFCEIMRLSGAIDYKIIGAEKLQSDKHCLVVANHPSLIDYVLIVAHMQQCDCLVKESIWNNPFMKGVVSAAGYIPNKNPETLVEDCAQRLSQGHVLLIFPEGTRSTPGVKSKLQRGAAQVALKTASDIRVVHITVAPVFLTKQRKWYQVPDKKPFFLLEVKEKIEINTFIKTETPSSIMVRKLNAHLENVIFPQKSR
ncbi:1-acyl-sn-glycerol-3-phosphate acyltransferase [Psychromonas sp. CNPT3]|uniref:lysophospholipid acyltransferase family protein n=1 Tax=Psychromonas sp. CNPT3 TaxID=314282 RepID=UPI00006E791C|nr:lysophospholipid acyltransferase family protein [Psychromonas sp. CNPT3]AGH79968.1 1-acyl-sn-glycerol-3-phosphate acyltransferase [Psychromonas sp. CNPT3]